MTWLMLTITDVQLQLMFVLLSGPTTLKLDLSMEAA